MTEQERTNKIMNRVQEHYNRLKELGYDVVCTCLQGSQNYGLDEYTNEYTSDIDTKSIIVPSLDDIVKGTSPVSTVIEMENGEHAEVKDIRVMFEMFKKMNISYIELLYTDYKIITPEWYNYIYPIFEQKECIANFNRNQFLRCIAGMAYEKQKAICHPYPGVIQKILEYGYDGKQLSHTVRLWEFISRYTNGEPLSACYHTTCREMLMNYKKQLDSFGNPLDKDSAVELENLYVEKIRSIKDSNLTEFDQVDILTAEFLDRIKFNLIKQKMFREVTNIKKEDN